MIILEIAMGMVKGMEMVKEMVDFLKKQGKKDLI